MQILITAPSLDTSQNVSGISTIVNTIIDNNFTNVYFHYLLGRADNSVSKIDWLCLQVKQLLYFPVYVRKNKIEIVHQNLPFDPKGLLREFIINLWCYLLHTPVVLHVHGGEFLMKNKIPFLFTLLAKFLFTSSKEVLVLSELEKEALSINFNFKKAKILSNSIDSSMYKTTKPTEDTDKMTLLFLGRIHESKGVEDICEALVLLREKMQFRLLLCGTGPLKDYMIQKCQHLLNDDFEYRGIVSGADKLKVIQESDIFLLPSRYGEGLPMAMLETMAAGVVPCVTDDASMKYVVHHKQNGIRVDKRNPKDMYEKLYQICTNKELYRSVSQAASLTIQKEYDIKEYVKKLNFIYKSAILK